MKTKAQILARKALHLGLLIPFAIFWALDILYFREQAIAFMLIILSLFVLYEYLRLDLSVSWLPFRHLIKPKEAYTTVDGLNLVLACLVIHILVPYEIAVATTLIAIIGDATSTLGGLYGRIKLFPESSIKTTWEGVVMTLFVNMTLAAVVLGFTPAMLVMSLSAVVIESAVRKVDDNIAVPILVAGLGTLTYWLSS